jgi:hypothetical protein
VPAFKSELIAIQLVCIRLGGELRWVVTIRVVYGYL